MIQVFYNNWTLSGSFVNQGAKSQGVKDVWYRYMGIQSKNFEN